MFAIMYEVDGTKICKICQTYDEAITKANNIACMGVKVTVFDYDKEADEYLEFYTI